MKHSPTTGTIAGFILLAFGLAACGEAAATDDGAAGDTPAPSEAEPDAAASHDHPTVAVTGVDYAFEGLPAEVAVGTELTFTNASDTEVHELVLFRRPDGEDRPIDELLALPEEEQALVFEGVAFAMPGEEGPVADGDLILDEAGDYVLVCHLPVGATPEVVEDEDFDPEAAPHFAEGMVHEFTVS